MFQTLKLIIQILPMLFSLMEAVETSIPEGGKGKEKLQFVRETFAVLYPQILEIWPSVEKIITSAVVLFNVTGKFPKKDSEVNNENLPN